MAKGSTRTAGLRNPTGTVLWKACRGTGGTGCTEMINGIWGGLGDPITPSTTHTHTQQGPLLPRGKRPARTWAPLSQCCDICTWTHLSLSTKMQRNVMRLKSNSVGIQLGQILDKRYKNTKKPQNKTLLPLLKSQEAGYWVSRSRVLSKQKQSTE